MASDLTTGESMKAKVEQRRRGIERVRETERQIKTTQVSLEL